MPQYSFMPETKKLRITQKHLMRAIFMQIWQLEVIFDSWLKNKYIIWQAWNYISMQLWFRPVLIGINRFCSLRELQTNDCECWYARWVLHRDYRYMQNPLNFGAWTICQHLYRARQPFFRKQVENNSAGIWYQWIYMYIRLSPYNIDVAATITVPVLYGTSTSVDAFEKACWLIPGW